MLRKAQLNDLMVGAEKGPQFKARHNRPHLAQEYRENQKPEDAESICMPLMPHARTRARGETKPQTVPWWRTKKGRQETLDAVR